MVNPDTPLPQAFDYVGLGHWANLVVSIGAIASLATWSVLFNCKNFFFNYIFYYLKLFSLYASMFPMPRVVYSLASDGLIFKQLSYVMPKLKTPVAASISSGLLAGKSNKKLILFAKSKIAVLFLKQSKKFHFT